MGGQSIGEIGIRLRGESHRYPPLIIVHVLIDALVFERAEMLLRQYRLTSVVVSDHAYHGEMPLCYPGIHYLLQFVLAVRNI